MRWGKWKKRPDSIAIAIAAAVLLCLLGTMELAQLAFQPGPRVGDIIAFRQRQTEAAAPEDAQLTVVHAKDGASCDLDTAAIRHAQGSLIVEQREEGAARFYRVHWSGARTSLGPRDCGPSADLTLRDTDMETLATAAGGYAKGFQPIGALFRPPGLAPPR